MLYIFILTVVLALFFIKQFSGRVSEVLIKNGEAEARRVITLIINNSISKDAFEGVNMDSLFTVRRDSNNDIEIIDFDTVMVTELLDSIINMIQVNLNAVEDGDIDSLDIDLRRVSDIDYEELRDGIIYCVSMGSASGVGLLNNVGPSIPIKLVMVGDVVGSFSSDVKEYGINNALIEVSVDVEVTMLVNMFFTSREVKIESSVPIIMKVVQGSVPDYYMKNGISEQDGYVDCILLVNFIKIKRKLEIYLE